MIEDADLNGIVDQHDLGAMARNWQRMGDALWEHGDFTDDGKVNVLDLWVLANHWLLGPEALEAALMENGLPVEAVPEPGVAGVIGSVGVLMMRRRPARKK